MRNLKLLSSSIAAMIAVATMVPAFTQIDASAAAQAGKVTFTGEETAAAKHAYTAYRIFKGTADASKFEDGTATKQELVNPVWDMTASNAATFLTNLKADATIGADFTNATNEAEVAAVLAGYENNSAKAKAFAEFVVANKALLTTSVASSADGSITLGEDGYYVIEETSLTPDSDGNGTMTSYLLGVYDSATGAEIAVKTGLPSFEKKIKDTNDSDADKTQAADGSTNGVWQDSADYDISDAVPFQLTATLPDNYSSYKRYKLAFHDDFKDSATGKVVFNNPTNFVAYVDVNQNGTKDSGDIDLLQDTDYTVSTTGSTLTNPSYTSDMDITFENLKTNTKITSGNIVFEYTATLTQDAVIGSAGNWNGAFLEYSNNPNHKDEGDPTSKTPEDKVVAFTYELDANKIDSQGKSLNGAGFTLYKYNKDTSAYESVGTEIKGVTKFDFKGIDAGKYKLVETTVPNGYNKADDLIFLVKAEHDETADVPTLKSLTVTNEAGESLAASGEGVQTGKFTVSTDTGILDTDIVNNSGSSLPTTGGIGTTIFYIAGGAVVILAGVVLITKKRAKDAE